MKLTRRVKVCGTQLDELAPEIVIQGVDLGNSKENISAVDRLGGFGQRITGAHWQTLEASVKVGINVPKINQSKRAQIWEQISNWCANKSGWLSITFDGRSTLMLPGPEWKGTTGGGSTVYQNRRMYVDKVIMPSAGDLYKWTDEYTIIFRAYNVPFWQDETATTVSSGVSKGMNIMLTVPGRVLTPVDVTFVNRSGQTINNFQVQTNQSVITLTGISLGGSATLTISHGTDGLMSIKKGSTSLYEKYTGSDDLLIGPGNQVISYSTDRAGLLTASVFGRYV